MQSNKIPFGPTNKSHPAPKCPNKLLGIHRSTLPTIPKNLYEKNEYHSEQQQNLEQNFDTICELIEKIKMSRGKYIPDYMLKSKVQSKSSSNLSSSHSISINSNSMRTNCTPATSINMSFSSPPVIKSSKNVLLIPKNEIPPEPNPNELPIVNLYNNLNSSINVSNLPEKIILLIIEMIKKNLLLPVPEVPKQYVYCDQIALLTLENWSEFEYLHKIVFLLIRQVDNPIFTTFLKSDFIRSLISILNSPDSKEQSSIEQMITAITEKFPETIELVYNESLSRIVHHVHDDIEGKTTYFCVSSCLKFILNYFKQPVSDITSPNVFEFKIFPLFSSYFLSEFYKNLNTICSMFYGLFDGLSSSSLRYLLTHWPETHTNKQIVYIYHIAVILQNMNSEKLKVFLKPLMKRFKKCLHSSNYKIIAATLQNISNPSFLYQFSAYSEKIITYLYPPLSHLVDYWHPDVRLKVVPAIDFLAQMNPTFFESFSKKVIADDDESLINDERIQNNWIKVSQAATRAIGKKAIKSFNKDLDELKKIDEIEFEMSKTKNNEEENNENGKENVCDTNEINSENENEIATKEEFNEKK